MSKQNFKDTTENWSIERASNTFKKMGETLNSMSTEVDFNLIDASIISGYQKKSLQEFVIKNLNGIQYGICGVIIIRVLLSDFWRLA